MQIATGMPRSGIVLVIVAPCQLVSGIQNLSWFDISFDL
jgi:hypothetical protein